MKNFIFKNVSGSRSWFGAESWSESRFIPRLWFGSISWSGFMSGDWLMSGSRSGCWSKSRVRMHTKQFSK